MKKVENCCPRCGSRYDVHPAVKTRALMSLGLGFASLLGLHSVCGVLAVFMGCTVCINHEQKVSRSRDFAVAGIALGSAGFGLWLLDWLGIALSLLVVCVSWFTFTEIRGSGKLNSVLGFIRSRSGRCSQDCSENNDAGHIVDDAFMRDSFVEEVDECAFDKENDC